MKFILFIALLVAVTVTARAQSLNNINPEYGTVAASKKQIIFTNDSVPGDFIVLDLTANSGYVIKRTPLEGAGAIGFLNGNKWLVGMTNAASANAGEVFVFDAGTAMAGSLIANVNDIRDLAVIQNGSQFNALIADRANDTVHLLSDVFGATLLNDITPSSIAGNVGIQGLVALNESLYFLYDELPEDGFGSDELIVVEGSSTNAKTTRISWNTIGSAGAGLNRDELSVDFHNGLAVRKPDESTITLYLSNFGAFSENQIIQVDWKNAGEGFNFNMPESSVLFTENDLFNAIADNNGTAGDPVELSNSRGVAIIPGDNVNDDRLVIWVDDTGNANTYMVIYDFSSKSFSLFGGDALENIIDPTIIEHWYIK